MLTMRTAQRLGVAAICSILSPLPVAAEERVALVIGNSAYRHTAPLKNPRHDAIDVAAVLKGLGFHVLEGLDLDKAATERTIRDFAAALARAKVGLFFYAGHGLQVSGENYLVPIDAKLETASALEFEAVGLQLVQRVMERVTETNVLFLDACRDNPLARNLARALGTRSSAIGKGLAPVESGVGTLISFSTQPGNVALDGTGRNSPFASALVQQLTSSREDLSTILIGVRNAVMAETGNRQVPWEHSALRARFYLHGKPPGGSAAAGLQPQLSDAAQAWAATKDSKSEAVLKTFIATYQRTVFAELARARLKELEAERTNEVAALQAGPKAPQPGITGSTQAFDGVWVINWSGGANCAIKSGSFQIVIANGTISGGGGKLHGMVGASGDFSYEHPNPAQGTLRVRNTGKLAGQTGRGAFVVIGGPCVGTLELKKQGTSVSERATPPGQRAGPYDGAWEVALTGNEHCPFKTHSFPIKIDGSTITAPHPQPGRVDERGEFEFQTHAKGKPYLTVRYAGRFVGVSGEGKWETEGTSCAGTAVLKRQSVSSTR
jgi:hypothetical protein